MSAPDFTRGYTPENTSVLPNTELGKFGNNNQGDRTLTGLVTLIGTLDRTYVLMASGQTGKDIPRTTMHLYQVRPGQLVFMNMLTANENRIPTFGSASTMQSLNDRRTVPIFAAFNHVYEYLSSQSAGMSPYKIFRFVGVAVGGNVHAPLTGENDAVTCTTRGALSITWTGSAYILPGQQIMWALPPPRKNPKERDMQVMGPQLVIANAENNKCTAEAIKTTIVDKRGVSVANDTIKFDDGIVEPHQMLALYLKQYVLHGALSVISMLVSMGIITINGPNAAKNAVAKYMNGSYLSPEQEQDLTKSPELQCKEYTALLSQISFVGTDGLLQKLLQQSTVTTMPVKMAPQLESQKLMLATLMGLVPENDANAHAAHTQFGNTLFLGTFNSTIKPTDMSTSTQEMAGAFNMSTKKITEMFPQNLYDTIKEMWQRVVGTALHAASTDEPLSIVIGQ